MVVAFALSVLAFAPNPLCDGPPAGPFTWAYCPVTGKNVTTAGPTAVSVDFKNGQKLFVATAEAAAAYKAAPQVCQDTRTACMLGESATRVIRLGRACYSHVGARAGTGLLDVPL
mgnify:FL=1